MRVAIGDFTLLDTILLPLWPRELDRQSVRLSAVLPRFLAFNGMDRLNTGNVRCEIRIFNPLRVPF
jgi:hypothetical protein